VLIAVTPAVPARDVLLGQVLESAPKSSRRRLQGRSPQLPLLNKPHTPRIPDQVTGKELQECTMPSMTYTLQWYSSSFADHAKRRYLDAYFLRLTRLTLNLSADLLRCFLCSDIETTSEVWYTFFQAELKTSPSASFIRAFPLQQHPRPRFRFILCRHTPRSFPNIRISILYS
jgi:hypothetical protein